MAIILTTITKNSLINPSPFLTEKRLENQAPKEVPIAIIKPIFQLTLSFKTKTINAADMYIIMIIAFVAFDFTKDNRLKKCINKIKTNPKPALIKPP